MSGRGDRNSAIRTWVNRAASAVALLFGASLALAGSLLAAAKEDKVFTVGNYPVEARAADAVAAKERAISEGQQAAFRSLLKRIVPVAAYNRIGKLKSVKASDLIDGIAVRSERNSSTDYIASYDFSFQPEAVRRILDREGIPFLDRQAPQVTVVPIYRAPAGQQGLPETFSDARGSDTWLYAWKGLDLSNTLTPLSMVSPKKETHPDTIKAMAEGSPGSMRTFGGDYGTETIIMALLEPDFAQKRIHVTLSGRDAVAPFRLKRVYRMESGDLAYTAELAAVISLGILEGRWKAINVRSAGSVGPAPVSRPSAGDTTERSNSVARSDLLNIAIEFRSMGEWQQISRQLSSTPEVSDVEVLGLSGRSARVALRYPSGPQNLAVALAQNGLILRNAGGGWVLAAR